MLTANTNTPQPHATPNPNHQPSRIAVGIDTSRYGHYAAFLRHDLQPAADELPFAESANGYTLFRQRLEHIAGRHHAVTFDIRLDAAGQYADNLLHFLQQLGQQAPSNTCAISNANIIISCGDPQRNKNYRAALFGSKKSDPIEARAAARFALSERPKAMPLPATELRTLRQVAGRLQATVRQRTRTINQFHHLMALAFPELALLVKDISQGWVLELVHRYPTATLLATATPKDLAAIPYMPVQRIDPILTQARTSIASLSGVVTEELVRDQVRQLRDVQARQKRLENTLVHAYRQLPKANHLATIPGIGDVTAAVLTAFILDIDRFDSPGKLVAYFGVLPIEMSSGIDRDGQPRGSRRYVMSKRGNDLVRRYLWMAALSAIRCNPAVRALYGRVVARHPGHKAIAVGHGMRKLLHLVFALWKSDRPFDAKHYAWEQSTPGMDKIEATTADRAAADAEIPSKQTAGHTPELEPAEQVVTAACDVTVADEVVGDESIFINFAHLKSQLSLARVLEHLGLLSRLRGSGPQRRGACPLHRGDGRSRTFSVNLADNVFHCFAACCGKEGDVIDLWAQLHQMTLRAAAVELVQTFGVEPAAATEKRHG
jgi:transposase